MGIQNRQRRRAKRAAKARSQRDAETRRQRDAARAGGSGWSWAGQAAGAGWSEELVADLVQEAAHARCEKRADRDHLIGRLLGAPGGLVVRQLQYRITSQIQCLLQYGWDPVDLWEISRRRAGAMGTALAAGAIRATVSGSDDVEGSDRWDAQCASFDTERQLAAGAPDWPAQVGAAADLVGVLDHLGALRRLDGMGAATPQAQDPERASLLTKIKRLLAMAESTAFPEEADTFTAKATELMLRHRIDRAAVEGSSGTHEAHDVVARRCWMEAPYVDQKSFLCLVVAEANNCRAVWHDYGFSTIVGQPDDIDMTELLFASLLVQATRQMTAAGASAQEIEDVAKARAGEIFATWRAAGVRTVATEETLRETIAEHLRRERRNPSFRRSFLVAYAKRIEQRLAELRRDATAAAEAELGTSFLPVLARQEEEVDEAVGRLFGKLSSSRVRTTNQAGWIAGTAAADLADLNVRDELRTG